MKTFNKLLLLSVCSIFSFSVFAQDAELLESLPKTKEEFKTSESRVLATINWLESTPLNQDEAKRKQQNALLIAWITDSPTVTIELNSNVLTFTKKNSDLLIIFMGGWTKFALENAYSKDVFVGSLAGVKAAIKFYKMGNGIKKDKAMDKLVTLEENGELAKWVKEQVEKK
jgi:hypothetical protein